MCWFSTKKQNKKGGVTIYKTIPQLEVLEESRDPDGRYLIFKMRFPESKIYMISNNAKVNFLEICFPKQCYIFKMRK